MAAHVQRTRQLTAEQADAAITDLLLLPITVLAEAIECLLLTADRRLANAPGPTCEIELL